MPADGHREMKVLSIPGRNSTTQYVPLFVGGLEASGVEVCDMRSADVLGLKIDVVHLHFPVHYIAERSLVYSLVRSAFLVIFLSIMKYVGRASVVYTVHDPIPFRPRSGWLMWPMLDFIHHLVDGYVFLSDGSQQDFIARFPKQAGKPSVRVDHSSFPVSVDRQSRLEALTRPAAKPSMDIGYLGMIKDYKGMDCLQSLPAALGDGTPIHVLVAGKVDPTHSAVADPILASLGPNVTRLDRRLSDAELDQHIQSSDVVFLPYTRGWNSGMAMLVLSCFTPILSTRQLPFVELEQKLGLPWVRTFDDAADRRADSLKRALNDLRQQHVTAEAVERLAAFLAERSFAAAAVTIADFYAELRAAR